LPATLFLKGATMLHEDHVTTSPPVRGTRCRLSSLTPRAAVAASRSWRRHEAGEARTEAVRWRIEARQHSQRSAVDAGVEVAKPASRGRRPASGSQCNNERRPVRAGEPRAEAARSNSGAADVGGGSRRAAGRRASEKAAQLPAFLAAASLSLLMRVSSMADCLWLSLYVWILDYIG